MHLLEGKKISETIQMKIASQITEQVAHFKRKPCLAVILVGSHGPSHIYVNHKIGACQKVGMISLKKELPETISEESLLHEIFLLNQDPAVDGILVQLPLPSHIDPLKVTYAISAEKDVDGFHPINLGKMFINDPTGFLPCTPLGIRTLFEYYEIKTQGKNLLVIGRSNIVGKPAATLFMQNHPFGNATVTVAHSHTKNLKTLCLSADILIVGIGQPNFLKAEMVKEGAVVIDVGTNQIKDLEKKSGKRLVGDVDFKEVQSKCSFITPVPGGVGPMTIAMLLQNTLTSYQRKRPQEKS